MIYTYAGTLPAPTNVQIICRNAVMVWDDVDNATGYEVIWRLLDENLEPEIIRVVRNRTEIALRNLSASFDDISRRYSARITSLQKKAEGKSSPEFVFATNFISECANVIILMISFTNYHNAA